MRNFVMAFLIVTLTACGSSKKVKQTETTSNEVNSSSVYRLTVSFISIGTGVDGKAKQQFLDFKKEYELKNSVMIVAEIAQWGREGETDYCLKLSELNSKEQSAFVSDIKALLKDNKLVQFSENTECKNKLN